MLWSADLMSAEVLTPEPLIGSEKHYVVSSITRLSPQSCQTSQTLLKKIQSVHAYKCWHGPSDISEVCWKVNIIMANSNLLIFWFTHVCSVNWSSFPLVYSQTVCINNNEHHRGSCWSEHVWRCFKSKMKLVSRQTYGGVCSTEQRCDPNPTLRSKTFHTMSPINSSCLCDNYRILQITQWTVSFMCISSCVFCIDRWYCCSEQQCWQAAAHCEEEMLLIVTAALWHARFFH